MHALIPALSLALLCTSCATAASSRSTTAPPRPAASEDLVSARLRASGAPRLPPGARFVFGEVSPWEGARTFAFSPDGRQLAWAHATHVLVEEIATGKSSTSAPLAQVVALAFVDDGLAAVTERGTITVLGFDGAVRWERNLDAVSLAATAERGGVIAVATGRGELIQLAARDGQELARRQHELIPGDGMEGLAYARGGDLLSFSRGRWIRWRADAPEIHVHASVVVESPNYVNHVVSPRGDVVAFRYANRRGSELVDLTSGQTRKHAQHVVGFLANDEPFVATAPYVGFLPNVSPDGRTVAYHRSTGSLLLRDVVSGAQTAQTGAPDGLIVAPAGTHAYVRYAGVVQRWSLPDGARQRTTLASPPLAFSADGSRFVTSTGHQLIVHGEDETTIREIDVSSAHVEGLEFLTANELVFTFQRRDEPPLARRVALDTGTIRDVPFGIGSILDAAVSPDGKLIAASNLTGGVEGIDIVDLTTGRLVRRVRPGRAFLAFANEGRALIALDSRAGWTRWDLATGRAVARVHRLGGGTIQYSPDGAHVALVFATGESTPRQLVVYETQRFTPVLDVSLDTVVGGYTDLAFSQDGRTIVTALHDGRVVGWDLPR